MGTVFVSSGAEGATVEKVLGSKTFARNPRLMDLLAYLCQRKQGENGGSLKEYDIATDVFHRPPEFDQTTDAIVRVEMHRLRKKLREYYATEGAEDEIEISLQAGRYVPEFLKRIPRQESSSAPEVTAVQDSSAKISVVVRRSDEKTPEETVETLAKRPAAIRSYQLGLLAIVLVGLATAGFFWSRRAPVVTRKTNGLKAAANSLPAQSNSAVIPRGGELHMLCGSSETGVSDRQGHSWTPDRFYSGGNTVKSGEKTIFRTRNAALFATARTGAFSYKIPLKPGLYEMRLYFADPDYRPDADLEGGEGRRTFMVRLNGVVVLHDFDIIAEAGPNTADVKVFKDVQPERDGFLHLDFVQQVGEPLLNAIAIEPGLPHRLRPIRLTTQDREFTDRSGVKWTPDSYFLQGRLATRYGPVSGSLDPQIFERERYGNFSYAIPVAKGSSYKVNLYFAESFFGTDQPGGGGAGNRIFDVFCNGRALLQSFDMYKEAGANHQIVKTFAHLKPNAQGTLLFSFVPVKNYANVSAIAIEDESK